MHYTSLDVHEETIIPPDMLPRRFAPKSKNPLSGGVQSFLTGC